MQEQVEQSRPEARGRPVLSALLVMISVFAILTVMSGPRGPVRFVILGVSAVVVVTLARIVLRSR